MEECFLKTLCRTVHQRLDDPGLGVDDLCRSVHLSRSQLHRKLKRQTGKSATLFIREIRLKKAYRLLKNKQYTVTETALETGFQDPAFFSRVFKKNFGVPPSKIKGK